MLAHWSRLRKIPHTRIFKRETLSTEKIASIRGVLLGLILSPKAFFLPWEPTGTAALDGKNRPFSPHQTAPQAADRTWGWGRPRAGAAPRSAGLEAAEGSPHTQPRSLAAQGSGGCAPPAGTVSPSATATAAPGPARLAVRASPCLTRRPGSRGGWPRGGEDGRPGGDPDPGVPPASRSVPGGRRVPQSPRTGRAQAAGEVAAGRRPRDPWSPGRLTDLGQAGHEDPQRDDVRVLDMEPLEGDHLETLAVSVRAARPLLDAPHPRQRAERRQQRQQQPPTGARSPAPRHRRPRSAACRDAHGVWVLLRSAGRAAPERSDVRGRGRWRRAARVRARSGCAPGAGCCPGPRPPGGL